MVYCAPAHLHLIMEGLYIIIPIALLFFAIGIAVFFWASKSGQFDDLEGPAHAILMDDEKTVED